MKLFTQKYKFLSLFVVLVIVFSVSQSETPSTPIEGALTLNLSGVLVEQRTQTDPTVQLLRQMDKGDEQPSEIVLSDLLWAIKSAGNDDRIKALVIKPQGLQGASLSKLQEVASAIDAFKESGKPVIAINAATYWHALRANGIMDKVEGCGRLLEEF